MFKRFKDHDKQLVEYQFVSGSTQSIPFANMQDYTLVQNVSPYDDNNKVRFGIKGSTFLPKYFNETNDFAMNASGAATYGALKEVFDKNTGKRIEDFYGIADHYIRFFTTFNQNERTQVPIVLIAPVKNSKLYNLPASSFTVEIKYYPEKAGGPNDGLCNLTLTGSTKLSNSFIDSDLISFHSISQDNKVLHSRYGAPTMGTATASFHFRFAGNDEKVAMPAKSPSGGALSVFESARPRFYGHPNPVIEIFGMSGSEGSLTDKYPASLSRDDPSRNKVPPAWKRPGVLSSSVGYHLSCSNWNYSYITWRTGSDERYSGSLRFDKYGAKNGFIGGVVNYTKDEKGNEHFATMSTHDPGQVQNRVGASEWVNVTGSSNFRKLGNNLGLIQLGGKLTPGNIAYPAVVSGKAMAQRIPVIAESEHDVHRGTAGGLQEGISGSNPYYGGIKELRIWNSALDHNTLATWSMKELDNEHPYLGSLVGYWRFETETGKPRLNNVGKGTPNKLGGTSGAGLYYPWSFTTSSFILKEKAIGGVDDAYFVCQPQSGSGYLPNNDSSSFTAMDKRSYIPGLNSAQQKITNTTMSRDGSTAIKETATVYAPFEEVSSPTNPNWYSDKWNPFIAISIPNKSLGNSLATGSAKFRFDLTRVLGAPIVAGSSLHKYHHSFSNALYRPADGTLNFDRDDSNKVIRPSMYTLPRGVRTNGTTSYNVYFGDNGSGSIYPVLNYTNVSNRQIGAVSYADGIASIRDATYAGLHNFYIYYASAHPYPTGAREIRSVSKTVRAKEAATGSGYYNSVFEHSGSLKTYRLQLNCRANFNEFNASTNKTFAKAFAKVTSSLGNTGSVTYISSIGLYDDNNNLIGVGKLATPIRKEPGQAITTKLRLDL